MLKSSSSQISAILLCAGKGSRFKPHTSFYPKPLIPFLNLPLFAYNMYLLKTLNVKRLSVNLHTHPFLLEKALNKFFKKTKMDSLVLSHEESLLGSAGGLLKLKSFFKNSKDFFYLNGDSFILLSDLTNTLNEFYRSHVKSHALASFLVKPLLKKPLSSKSLLSKSALNKSLAKSFIWADDSGQVHSFLKPALGKSNLLKPYDFSGLAIFSPKIFKEIKPSAFHIFKDVLELKDLKKHCRVYPISPLKLLDMNQLDTYLKGTAYALKLLKKSLRNRGDIKYDYASYLREVLNFYSPRWNFFEGENYFSDTCLKNPPPASTDKKNILFCGKDVKGLKNLLVKNFACVGDRAFLSKPLTMESSVLGEALALKNSLKNSLLLK